MSEFDSKAATWDENPDRVKRSKEIAKRINEVLDLRQFDNALEYGSGTGLLSFELRDKLKKITLMDQSEEMIKMADSKIKTLKVNNIHGLHYDLLEQPLPQQRYDLIFTLLTLHHIQDIDNILFKFSEILIPQGTLVIIDLEKEDGSFHDGDFHGHKGFDQNELEFKLKQAGLASKKYEVCYELEKEHNSVIRKYPLFILIAQKN